MSKKLYVGNLSYDMENTDLENAFSEFGSVESANVIIDRQSGRSKGFGFVEMATEEQAKAAMDAMDGQELSGRPLKVNLAKPQEDRPRSSGGRPGGSRPGGSGGRPGGSGGNRGGSGGSGGGRGGYGGGGGGRY